MSPTRSLPLVADGEDDGGDDDDDTDTDPDPERIVAAAETVREFN